MRHVPGLGEFNDERVRRLVEAGEGVQDAQAAAACPFGSAQAQHHIDRAGERRRTTARVAYLPAALPLVAQDDDRQAIDGGSLLQGGHGFEGRAGIVLGITAHA